MDIIKNPIVIGLTMGTLVYGYLSYTINERNEENEKKKKGKRKEKESVNLLIPLVVIVIAWFIAYAYFEYNNEDHNKDIYKHTMLSDRQGLAGVGGLQGLPLPFVTSPKFGFANDIISETSEPRQFSLIGTGLTVPDKLPDILLDVR